MKNYHIKENSIPYQNDVAKFHFSDQTIKTSFKVYPWFKKQ